MKCLTLNKEIAVIVKQIDEKIDRETTERTKLVQAANAHVTKNMTPAELKNFREWEMNKIKNKSKTIETRLALHLNTNRSASDNINFLFNDHSTQTCLKKISALRTISHFKEWLISLEQINTDKLLSKATSIKMVEKTSELSDLVKKALTEKALTEKGSAPQKLNAGPSKNNSTRMKALINEHRRKIKSRNTYANMDKELLQRKANYEEGLKQNKLNIIERNKRIKENRNIENAKRQTMKERVRKRRNAKNQNHVRLSLKKINKQKDRSLNNSWTDVGKPYTKNNL